jgi:uroporphyrinogen-III synthase
MHLLVTRPEPDAMKLAGLLEQRGHVATVEPLMHVAFNEIDDLDLADAAALIATSRNGLRALVGSPVLAEARRVPVFAVGRSTAEEARRMGFEQILVGAGTAADLVPAITGTLEASAGVLVHLRGERIAYDLKGELEQLGYRINEHVAYVIKAASRLSPATIERFHDGDIEGVILLSAQTAKVYVRLIQRYRLNGLAREPVYFCLSQAVASELDPLQPVKITIGERPALDDLLAQIELTAASLDE